MIKNRIAETKIVQAVENLFNFNGITEQFKEVKFCERSIDLFAKDKEFHIAVEAKVNAISQAFKQAERYRYVADYLYVALLKNSSNKRALELSESTGIGIIFVEGNTEDDLIAYFESQSLKFEKKVNAVSNHIWENKKLALSNHE